MAQQQDMGLQPPAPPTPPELPGNGGGAGELQAQYTIYGTGEPYNGMVVQIGGQLYTTQGGALEGYSYQVYPGGAGNLNNQKPGPGPQSRPSNSIFFRRGDGSKYDRVYWLPLDYSGPWGNPGGPVLMGTPLHYLLSRGQVFTEHGVGGSSMGLSKPRPSVMVTISPPIGGGLRRVPNVNGNGNDTKPDFSDKLVDDPMVDDSIIIDDPMAPDPFTNQGGSNY